MLSVIIPAYNEQESVASVVARVDHAITSLIRLHPQLLDGEILIVDDGSTDETAARARVSSRVRVIDHARNQGYGAALKTAFLESRGDLIAFLDADGTYPPEQLVPLCEPVIEGRADMAVGVRSRASGTGMPLIRRLGNSFFARALSWVASVHVSDSASGMRVFRRAVLPRLLPLPDGLDFIVGLTTRALHEGLRIVEIPIPYDERQGRSKLSVLGDGLRFLRTLIVVAVTYNPLRFLGSVAALTLLLAGYLGLGPVMYYLRHGAVADWEIYRLATILVLGVIGLQLMNLGIIGNRLLALLGGAPRKSEGLLEKVLLGPGFARASWKIGAVLCLGAVGLNRSTIVQYLTLRSIDVHWSFIITGATMFLVGAQLLMVGALLLIFLKVEDRQRYIRGLTFASPAERPATAPVPAAPPVESAP